jgi:hypothetical protein
MRTFLGLIVLALAILLLSFELIALADPVGTQMANDADPFGPPPPWYVHAAWFAVIAVLGWASVRLLSPGIVGRLIRGRGLTPAPIRF